MCSTEKLKALACPWPCWLVPGLPSVLTEVTWESLGPKASPAPSTHLKPVTTHHHHLHYPTLRPAPAWFIFVMSLCCCYLGNIPWKMLGEVGRLTGRGRPQTHCGWMAGGRLSHEGLSGSHPRTAHPILPALFSQPPPQAEHQVCAFLGGSFSGLEGCVPAQTCPYLACKPHPIPSTLLL